MRNIDELTPPTPADHNLNLDQRLADTEQAIASMLAADLEVPGEAYDLLAIFRRAVFAEAVCRQAYWHLDTWGVVRGSAEEIEAQEKLFDLLRPYSMTPVDSRERCEYCGHVLNE